MINIFFKLFSMYKQQP